MTNGENQSSAASKLIKIDAAIDELYQKYGIDPNIFTLTDEDYNTKNIFLTSVCFKVQIDINRLKAKYNFLETLLNRTIYPETKQYSGSWNAQYYSAINDNTHARELHNQMLRIKVDLDALDYVVRRIEAFTEILMQMSKTKKWDKS